MANGGQPGATRQQADSATGNEPGHGTAASNPGQNPGQGGQRSQAGSSAPASGDGNGPGTGKLPGGGGQRSNIGGGGQGNQAGDPGSAELPKDETKPSPPAEEVENPFGNESAAPTGGPEPLGGLADALKDAATAKELEERTGMTKEQIEHFVKKYEKPKLGAGRDGKEIEVKVGSQPAATPASNLPPLPTRKTSSTKIRQEREIPQDTARGNNEGNRDTPPAEFRDRYAGYLTKMSRLRERRAPAPRPQPAGEK